MSRLSTRLLPSAINKWTNLEGFISALYLRSLQLVGPAPASASLPSSAVNNLQLGSSCQKSSRATGKANKRAHA